MDTTQQTNTNNWNNAVFTPLYHATPDFRGFLESVLGFSGLANKWFRVRAEDQRRYFGRTPFGKCAIKVSETGVVKLIKTKAFGRDFDSIEFFLNPTSGTFHSMWDEREIKTPANI
jgi:hypothetical protein